MENGSWAPMAAKHMRAIMETLKEVTIQEPVVTIKSAPGEAALEQMKALAESL